MKLWQKMFLPILALMVLSTTITSTMLLKTNRDTLWQREGQRVVTQQQYLAGLLRSGVVTCRLQMGIVQIDGALADQTVCQILSQQARDGYLAGLVLFRADGELLYDDMPNGLDPVLPEPSAEEPGATVYQLRSSGEEWYLVCAMPVTLEGIQYRLGAAYIVGDLQEQMARQARDAVILCLAISLAGAAALLGLMVALLHPLAALDENARRLASGRYDERLTVRGGDELAGLAQNMNAMAQAVQERVEQLEQVAEDRKMFIANLAHEMKTPLTSILGFADLLYIPKQVPEEKRLQYAQVISEEAKRLRALSGKLLELTCLDSTSVQLAPASLRGAAEEVSFSLGPVMEQGELEFQCSCPDIWIDMDRELFKSLLYNLLDNARKASQRGGALSLSARRNGGQVRIQVEDHGRGIPKEELDKICQPFYMVDKSRSRKLGGTGLGLALCQKIVALHHGSMDIQSRVGQGTVVTLHFPVSAADPGGPEGGQTDALD